LIAEQDVLLMGIQMRRPDLANFSGEQIANSDENEEPIPSFVIEVISPTDDDICSASPTIADFQISVNELLGGF
jgi:hypothetical protein